VGVQEHPAGTTVFVTGAGSGIGRACALAFGRLGVRVAVSDLGADSTEETRRLVEEAGGEAASFPCDVSDADAIAAAVRGCVERFGRLDLAVNSAGVLDTRPAPIDTFAVEDFDRTIAVNLRGVFLSMKAELAAITAGGGPGAIVNLASGAGLAGIPERPSYNSSKHGVIGLTRNAALDYAQRGVRINAICPGLIETPMLPEDNTAALAAHPMGRMGTVDEIAAVAVFLCSPGASFVTGIAMPVDGGYLVP
jgi:NAD(P)-dependent dehydrogenase (short-subunit alcohol dehydrogenase family)